MKRLSEQGSISLFMALVLPALCFIFLLALKYSLERKNEHDFGRAMAATAEEVLANYDRKLWRDFALWGAPQLAANELAAQQILPPTVPCSLNVTGQQSVWEVASLGEAIQQQMKLRTLALLGKDILQRLEAMRQGRLALAQGQSRATVQAINQELKGLEASRSFPALPASAEQASPSRPEEYSPEPESEPSAGTVTTPLGGSLPEADINAVGSELAGADEENLPPFVRTALRDFSQAILPVYQASGMGENYQVEPFHPNALEGMAAFLDKVIDAADYTATRKLVLAEYVLRYFPAQVQLERRLNGIFKLQTPDGRQHLAILTGREAEAEQITSGEDEAEAARKKVKQQIIALRFVPQFIAGSQSASRAKRYQTWGKALSYSLKLASIGQVDIPPELCRYIVQAADSLRLAAKDYRELAQGEGIYFWPSESQARLSGQLQFVPFYYRDYLRILLLLRSETAILQDLAKLMQRHTAATLYASFAIKGQYRQKECELVTAFADKKTK